jgi:predicted nuclease of predicted toxin-antitoxin system
MRFLLDQSAEARIGTFLVSIGHDATRVGRDHPPGLPDEQVLAIAVSESRILITNDSDFGELIFKQLHAHTGVIYLAHGGYEYDGRPIADLDEAELRGIARQIRQHGATALAICAVFSPIRPDLEPQAAAIGQVSGEVDQVHSLEGTSRAAVMARARDDAAARAVAAGADPGTIEVVDAEDVPLAYLPGSATRVRVKVVGRLRDVGIRCHPLLATPEALAVVGPRAFGYDVEYRPLEPGGPLPWTTLG